MTQKLHTTFSKYYNFHSSVMITTCRSISVLLVDDSLANQKVIARMLEKQGHRVTFAQSGREALERFLNGRFDVILMDVKMPIMDGFQTAKAIREAERQSDTHTPIVALTASPAQDEQKKWLDLGMDAYMGKPINVDRLLALLGKISHGTFRSSEERYVREESNRIAMNIDRVDPAINFSAIMLRLGNDMELFQSFVEIFDDESPKLLKNIYSGVADRDLNGVRRAAHALRGLAVNFDAKALVDAAAGLEYAEIDEDFECVKDFPDKLTDEVVRVREALSAYRQK
jgi:two-component system, sensor histidine kinase and response regulator